MAVPFPTGYNPLPGASEHQLRSLKALNTKESPKF